MKAAVLACVVVCVLSGLVSTCFQASSSTGKKNFKLNLFKGKQIGKPEAAQQNRILSMHVGSPTFATSSHFVVEHFPEYADIHDTEILSPNASSLVDLAFDESDQDLTLLQGHDTVIGVAKAYQSHRKNLTEQDYRAFNLISKTPHLKNVSEPVYLNVSRHLVPSFLQFKTNLTQQVRTEIAALIDICQGGFVFIRFKPAINFEAGGRWTSSAQTLISTCQDSDTVMIYLHSVRMNSEMFLEKDTDENRSIVLHFVSRWLREATLCPL